MLSNDELKDIIANAKNKRGEYSLRSFFLDVDKNGGWKWSDVRLFETILYSEHFESQEELYKLCSSFGVPCCISPEHNQDVTDDGEIKKPHYHFIAFYEGKTSLYRFYKMLCCTFGEDSFFGFISGTPSVRVRYLAHLDDLDKFQYSIDDIKSFCGFVAEKYLFKYDKGDDELKKEIKKIIKENNILFYSELDDYLEDNEPILFSALNKNKPMKRDIIDYMKSREHQLFYQGDVIKGYTKIKMENGSEKVIFNRQLKQA